MLTIVIHSYSDNVCLAQIDPVVNNEVDYKFVFDQMESQIKNYPNRFADASLEKYLTDLSCEVSAEYCHEIRIYVINQPEFNAHMYPNGALILYAGLLLRLQTKAQLAYVIAHELAHYVQKHGVYKINYNKYSKSSSSQTGSLNPLKGIIRLKNKLLINNYSQQLEYQADLFSIEVLSKNNLPLSEVSSMFENLEQENSAAGTLNNGGFSSSHPGTRQRIKYFRQSEDISNPAKSSYLNTWPRVREKFIDQWIDSELSKRQFKSTLVLLKRLKSNSTHPCYYDYYFGEIFRKQGGYENSKKAISYYVNHLKECLANPVVNVYKRMAESHLELDKPTKARFYYTKYINLIPQPRDVHIVQRELREL